MTHETSNFLISYGEPLPARIATSQQSISNQARQAALDAAFREEQPPVGFPNLIAEPIPATALRLSKDSRCIPLAPTLPPTAVQVYIDNSLVYDNTSQTTYVNQNFSVAKGSHTIVVKAFDANGKIYSQTITINAQ